MYSCLAYCCVGSHLGLFWFSWNLGIIIFILSLEWALLFIWAYDCMIFIDSSLVFIMTIMLMSFYISPLYQAPGIFGISLPHIWWVYLALHFSRLSRVEYMVFPCSIVQIHYIMVTYCVSFLLFLSSSLETSARSDALGTGTSYALRGPLFKYESYVCLDSGSAQWASK